MARFAPRHRVAHIPTLLAVHNKDARVRRPGADGEAANAPTDRPTRAASKRHGAVALVTEQAPPEHSDLCPVGQDTQRQRATPSFSSARKRKSYSAATPGGAAQEPDLCDSYNRRRRPEPPDSPQSASAPRDEGGASIAVAQPRAYARPGSSTAATPVDLATAIAQIQACAAWARYDCICSRARLGRAIAKATKHNPAPRWC